MRGNPATCAGPPRPRAQPRRPAPRTDSGRCAARRPDHLPRPCPDCLRLTGLPLHHPRDPKPGRTAPGPSASHAHCAHASTRPGPAKQRDPNPHYPAHRAQAPSPRRNRHPQAGTRSRARRESRAPATARPPGHRSPTALTASLTDTTANVLPAQTPRMKIIPQDNQALDRSQPVLPMMPGMPERRSPRLRPPRHHQPVRRVQHRRRHRDQRAAPPAPGGGVQEVPDADRQGRARRAGRAPGLRQPRHAQDPRDPAVAGPPPPVPPALHPDRIVLDQPGRATRSRMW